MSRYTADRISADLNNRPAFVNLAEAQGLDVLRLVAQADPAREIAAATARRGEILAAYSFGVPAAVAEKPFIFADGVALIPIHGMLINRFPYSWGFVTGYNFVRDQTALAAADDDVKLIVFDVNSCGGTVAGCQETADAIYESRALKPSVAVIDSACYSGAYYLASQAGKMTITPSGGCANIGVIAMRLDLTGMLAEAGVKITMIHAGEYKTDGYPYGAMSEGEQARLQASVDEAYDAFVATVARGRGLSEQAIRDTEAACYTSKEALRSGLVDAINPPSAAVRDALACPEDQETDNEDDSEMTVKPADPAASPAAPVAEDPAIAAANIANAASAARTAERERINGILGCEEAKGRTKLAQHLASATDMDLAQAKAVLAVSETEKTADPAPLNPLAAVMDTTGGAGVSQTAGGAEGGGDGDKTAKILAAQATVTGRKALTQEQRT